ncbi:hypothetical protein COLO4_19592 [Corchorus olitorius]|uniref:Reverse transcriptase n=1 Tax=Corchorus olitorius TaxID=93759 RepID=A0A1R3J4P3_9ROSI|nr:hypothetical protein COLO4_19592 [Corchorus olitorius]
MSESEVQRRSGEEEDQLERSTKKVKAVDGQADGQAPARVSFRDAMMGERAACLDRYDEFGSLENDEVLISVTQKDGWPHGAAGGDGEAREPTVHPNATDFGPWMMVQSHKTRRNPNPNPQSQTPIVSGRGDNDGSRFAALAEDGDNEVETVEREAEVENWVNAIPRSAQKPKMKAKHVEDKANNSQPSRNNEQGVRKIQHNAAVGNSSYSDPKATSSNVLAGMNAERLAVVEKDKFQPDGGDVIMEEECSPIPAGNMGKLNLMSASVIHRMTVSRKLVLWKLNFPRTGKHMVLMKELRARIEGIQKALSVRSSHQLELLERDLVSQYNKILEQEEVFWARKSRVQWISHGEKNTSFFHLSTISRRRRNKVLTLKDDISGEWVTDSVQLKTMVITFFQNLYTRESGDMVPFNAIVHPSLSLEDKGLLCREISVAEVCSALFQMKPWKAPGVDGFDVGVYQEYWDTMGHSLFDLVKDAFTTGVSFGVVMKQRGQCTLLNGIMCAS